MQLNWNKPDPQVHNILCIFLTGFHKRACFPLYLTDRIFFVFVLISGYVTNPMTMIFTYILGAINELGVVVSLFADMMIHLASTLDQLSKMTKVLWVIQGKVLRNTTFSLLNSILLDIYIQH